MPMQARIASVLLVGLLPVLGSCAGGELLRGAEASGPIAMGREPLYQSGTYAVWFRPRDCAPLDCKPRGWNEPAPAYTVRSMRENCGPGRERDEAFTNQRLFEAKMRTPRWIRETQERAMSCAQARGLLPLPCMHGLRVLPGITASHQIGMGWIAFQCMEGGEGVRVESDLREGEWIYHPEHS